MANLEIEQVSSSSFRNAETFDFGIMRQSGKDVQVTIQSFLLGEIFKHSENEQFSSSYAYSIVIEMAKS